MSRERDCCGRFERSFFLEIWLVTDCLLLYSVDNLTDQAQQSERVT